MATIFFDTSALMRRYDQSEPGAAQVVALCQSAAGHTTFIGELTPIEVASALNRKAREERLGPIERDRLWRLFRRHHRIQYHAFGIDAPTLSLATRLLFEHPLRAYDAVQVASAMNLQRLLANLVGRVTFCTADRVQARAAAEVRLEVELIQ